MISPDDRHALAMLHARGANPAILDRMAGSGLSGAALRRAVQASGPGDVLRRWIRPWAHLSAAEQVRLVAISYLADEVLRMQISSEGAHVWWHSPLSALGGRTPAETLEARDGPAAVEKLIEDIKYGRPPG